MANSMGIKMRETGHWMLLFILACVIGGETTGQYIWAKEGETQNIKVEEQLEEQIEQPKVNRKKIQLKEGESITISISKQENLTPGNWNWYVKEEGIVGITQCSVQEGYAILQGLKKGSTVFEIAYYEKDGGLMVQLLWDICVKEQEKAKEEIQQSSDGEEIFQETIDIHSITQKKQILYLRISTCKEAKYYDIYRSLYKKKGYKKIGRTKKNSFKDNQIKEGRVYYYKVKAILKKNDSNEGDEFIESAPKKKKVKVYLPVPKLQTKLTSKYLKVTGTKVAAGTGVEVYIKEKGRTYKKVSSRYYSKNNQQIIFKMNRSQFQNHSTCYIKVRIFRIVMKKKKVSDWSNEIIMKADGN